jgi:V/A-type H+-transporting ATPase subunit I
MGVQSLVKVVVIAPKSETEKLFGELARFNWFDATEETSYRQRYELAEDAKRIRDQLVVLSDSLKLKDEPGVIEVLTKGYNVSREKLEVTDWKDYVAQVRKEAEPIIDEARKIDEEMSQTESKIEELESRKEMLEFASAIDADLGAVGTVTRFHLRLAVVRARDVKELKKSLPKVAVFSQAMGKRDSAVLVVGLKDDAQRVERVMKSFEARPLSLPEGLLEKPEEAFRRVREELDELNAKKTELRSRLERFKQEKGEHILCLLEASQIASSVLSYGSANPFRRFIKVEGHVPVSKLREFKETFKEHIVLTDGETGQDGKASQAVPTLISNPKYVNSFEEVTLTKGPPSYGEFDPTPIISIVFPIFYGFMFADAGQGILMFLLGLALWLRGAGKTKKWGVTIASFGAAATAVGLLTGEVFGLTTSTFPVVGDYLRKIVLIDLEPLKEGTGIETFMMLLVVAIIVGIVHITIGLTLDVAKYCRKREMLEVWTSRLPTLVFYLAGVVFGLAFIGNGFTFSGMLSSTALTPLLGLPIGTVTSTVLPVIFAVILVIAFGKAVARKLGKLQGHESTGIMVVEGIVEVLLKIVEFLANSISYARLGILMVVHVSLMVVVNKAAALGLAGLPIVVFGNVGVMMLEGLIVYIQDLRLHLYEWFTKFYDGEGRAFRTMVPCARRVDIVWKA